ncbi:MAG: hypothetical protein KF892_23665 [Rhizobacter sp.]|nr:hypothetical protein [Rhizobacter sp.]
MKYYLYCSSGNSLGLDEYIGYFENDGEGYCVRYVEIGSTGAALRYSEGKAADKYAQLPEGKWVDSEAAKAEYGHCIKISKELFETVWAKTDCDNG